MTYAQFAWIQVACLIAQILALNLASMYSIARQRDAPARTWIAIGSATLIPLLIQIPLFQLVTSRTAAPAINIGILVAQGVIGFLWLPALAALLISRRS